MSWAAVAERCPRFTGIVTELGKRMQPHRELSSAAAVESLEHHGEDVRFLRIRLELLAGGGEWMLTLRDEAGRVLQVLRPEDFPAPEDGRPRQAWTDRLASNVVRFEFSRTSGELPVRMLLIEYIATPSESDNEYTYYSYVEDEKPWTDLYGNDFAGRQEQGRLERMLRLGDSVAFLTSSRGHATWCCSGVLVNLDPVLLLTNAHCGTENGDLPFEEWWTPEVCERTFVDFSWDGDAVTREFGCAAVHSEPVLDLALLRLEPLTSDTAAPDPLPLAEALPSQDQAAAQEVFMIHHPECAPKRVTDNCRLWEVEREGWHSNEKTDFSHRCGTERGSSGSPVFDADGRILGIHHLGFQYDPALQDCDDLNKGVGVDSVRRFLDRGRRKLASLSRPGDEPGLAGSDRP